MATLAEYRTRLDREPLTINQLGRMHVEFARLGLDGPADRAERLRITAALALAPAPITSTKDLTMGQAGRAIRVITGCRTAGELYVLAEPKPRGILAALIAWLTE